MLSNSSSSLLPQCSRFLIPATPRTLLACTSNAQLLDQETAETLSCEVSAASAGVGNSPWPPHRRRCAALLPGTSVFGTSGPIAVILFFFLITKRINASMPGDLAIANFAKFKAQCMPTSQRCGGRSKQKSFLETHMPGSEGFYKHPSLVGFV